MSTIPRNLTVTVPAAIFPTFNVACAKDRNTHRNFLINTWGGLGDQVCAEPAIRYALRTFDRCDITLLSEQPELFSHLKFKEVIDNRKKPIVDFEKYLVFHSITPPNTLLWEFLSHMLCHCVDFPSVCMFRCTLPNADKEIRLPDYELKKEFYFEAEKTVVIHPGKHWPSKTFPASWWNQVIKEIKRNGQKVAIIGQKGTTGVENTGYVDVLSEGCIDYRDRLSITDLVAVLKHAKFLLSNDSSPIHIAAAGDAFIGFVASCKHPDYITHWRKGLFGWNSKNFGLDGSWNHLDNNPAQSENGEEITVEELPPGLMDKILPKPFDVADFYKGMMIYGRTYQD